jgi:hypothetical protein
VAASLEKNSRWLGLAVTLELFSGAANTLCKIAETALEVAGIHWPTL